MSHKIRKSWEVRRRKAIKRLAEAWEQDEDEQHKVQKDEMFKRLEKGEDVQYEDMGPYPTINASDAVAIAHLATLIEWEGGVRTKWDDKRYSALERLVAVCKKIQVNDDDLEAVKELNVAVNAFVIAHVAWSLAWDNGPVEWDKLEKPLEKRQ